MKTKKPWLIVFAAIAALTAAQTSRAITFGEPDNEAPPNAGAVMFVFPNLPNLPNPAQFLSGTLGDSGGPRYWIDPTDGSEHLVAITETSSPKLVSLDVAYRINTPEAQDFIEVVKEDYPLPLSHLAGEAKAAKRPPPAFVMWPTGAKLVLTYYPWTQIGLGPLVLAQWPSANGVDHYRVTVVFKSGGVPQVSTFTLDASRTDCVVGGQKGTYLVTVTAYSGPDEAVAYSESLEGRITSR
jgi:hypothetical protein